MKDADIKRILLLIGCVVAVNILLFWRHNVDMSENRNDLEAQIFTYQRKRDTLLAKNSDLERQIHRMELKLEHLETEVRDYTQARRDRKHLPIIFFITPTKQRPEQKADLTRLGQTLAHVPNLFWIIVEDAEEPSPMPTNLLKRLKFTSSVHIAAKTPSDHKLNDTDPRWKIPRGVAQRNAALEYLRTNHRSFKKSIVYFGDDDNTYDWQLFNEIRTVHKVGVWPVGIVGGIIVEAPIVALNGSVIGFTSQWQPNRAFPIDMAGFAVNLSLIIEHPDVDFKYSTPRGHQETDFLESLGLSRNDLEPKADFCTKVYVWHTRTAHSEILKKDRMRMMNDPTELSDVEKDAIF